MSTENEPTNPATDLKRALKMVAVLEKQAKRIDDPELKRIMLISGCDIIDRVLEKQGVSEAA